MSLTNSGSFKVLDAQGAIEVRQSDGDPVYYSTFPVTVSVSSTILSAVVKGGRHTDGLLYFAYEQPACLRACCNTGAECQQLRLIISLHIELRKPQAGLLSGKCT